MKTPGDDDKTQIKLTDKNNLEDRTRIVPPQKPAGQNAAVASPKTQIPKVGAPKVDAQTAEAQKIARPPQAAASPQIAAPADKTRVIPKTRPAQPATETPSDKTQFVAAKIPARTTSSDVTKVGPVPRDNSQEVRARDTLSAHAYVILKKRFVCEEILGTGGMGVVYKAKDLLKIEAQDREPYVAIKVLSDEFKSHPEAFIALQRESRKSQKIAHPNIVNVHDFDRDGDTVFMTMEYMEGKPLDKLISQYRSVGLPHTEVAKILEGICAALTYAHGQNIIHSDFKPGNIFVNNKGVAKVFDFGIARAVAKADHREESLDDRTVFDAGKLGALTPAYASLEMLEGLTPDVRDDIYALGCIAYELFAGVHPFNRVHADEAKRQKLKPKKIIGLKKTQWRAIEHALAFHRINRTESVEQFWREFTQKVTHTGKFFIAILLLTGLAVGAYFKFKPAAQVVLSEAEVRSQIELKLRLEQKMKALTDLLATVEFTPTIEDQLWTLVQELRQAKGIDKAWLAQQEAAIYNRYVKEIERALAQKDYQRAQVLTQNAYRYATQTAQLKAFELLIAEGIATQKRLELEQQAQLLQQQAQQKVVVQERQQVEKATESVAQKNSLFQIGLSNVNKQLECLSNIDMKDLDIAITKLRSLNADLYLKEEPRITTSLAKCIEYIGSSFPERALASKTYALRLFNGNAVIAAIKIVQKDPCSVSMAGLGARGAGASCKDKMSGISKAPAMVVVPAGNGMKAFAIGKYETSVDELNEFCQQSKTCEPKTDGDVGLPATNISISTANAYVKWLSEKSGRRYKLPTLQEWQYAAKAASGRIDQNRNCTLNSRGIQKGNALIRIAIGQQNEWGIINYVGNVQEWVAERDGSTSAAGGSFETVFEECNINYKVAHDGRPDNVTGFRVVRQVE
ncbi:MAG: protein kinase [Pseudomonadota bacterium]